MTATDAEIGDPPIPEFSPARWLRNPHLQSILASSRLRRWVVARRIGYPRRCTEHLLDCGEGVRLQGFHSRPTPARPHARVRGLAILVHGWEGCAGSSYIVSAAGRLLAAGLEVFRLNLRDHGDTHHLNTGIFHSCRIAEVVGAVREVTRLIPTRPVLLGGFSLGGNFSLRVGLRARAAGIPLQRVVAVSPVIDPARCMRAMERAPFFYQRYFIGKWRRSLRRKQRCFPDLYDFSRALSERTLDGMTRALVEEFTGFESLGAYLRGYSVAGDVLAGLDVPATVIAAEDDPIIPVCDLRALPRSGQLRVRLSHHGGHCGFLRGAGMESWAEEILDSALPASGPL